MEAPTAWCFGVEYSSNHLNQFQGQLHQTLRLGVAANGILLRIQKWEGHISNFSMSVSLAHCFNLFFVVIINNLKDLLLFC